MVILMSCKSGRDEMRDRKKRRERKSSPAVLSLLL
jgi:hypothetical protein